MVRWSEEGATPPGSRLILSEYCMNASPLYAKTTVPFTALALRAGKRQIQILSHLVAATVTSCPGSAKNAGCLT